MAFSAAAALIAAVGGMGGAFVAGTDAQQAFSSARGSPTQPSKANKAASSKTQNAHVRSGRGGGGWSWNYPRTKWSVAQDRRNAKKARNRRAQR